MDSVKVLKDTWITLILLLLTLISFILGFFNSDYVIIPSIIIVILLSWLIYSTGFLRIQIANENAIDDKRITQTYYSMKEWHLVDKKRDQVFIKSLMLFTILLIVFVLLFERLTQYPSLFSSEINEAIQFFVDNSRQIFAGLFIIIYLLVLFLLITKRLPEEMLNVFRGLTNILVFCFSLTIYISVGIWMVINQFLTMEAVMIGLFILPIALVISRVEGKFFYLFTINK